MDWHQRRSLAKLALLEAERVRGSLGVPRMAPIDPIDLASKYGCEVRFLKLPSLEGIYSPEPRPVIILGAERPAGRKRYTCAHELAHHVFKHGVRLEALKNQTSGQYRSEKEFLADVFAGFLLMPQIAVKRALKDRVWDANTLTPEQAYYLACYFGVGYSTVITQLTSSLHLMSQEYADKLKKTSPKQIKIHYGVDATSELIFVDYHWNHKTVDLDVGDILVLPQDIVPMSDGKLKIVSQADNGSCAFKAIFSGYSRAVDIRQSWGVNIRISRRHYEGLAQYRYFDESEEG
jgi:Zn-dependent peptidase ImmA (M78 family)